MCILSIKLIISYHLSGGSVRGTSAGSGQIWLSDVNCYGNESSIEDCRYREWGVYDCNHEQDVVIQCGK